MVPSLSLEAEPSKVTVKGDVPVTGVRVAAAVGALLVVVVEAVTTIGVLAELVNPLLSVTVSVVL